jgi:predicted MFS family arabinose efflux permease
MALNSSGWLAFGGLLALAAGMGIGRFVYTPILPSMIAALDWTKVDAGLVASANFLGYLVGALLVGRAVFARHPRLWLIAGLTVSTTTTAGMAVTTDLHLLMAIRFFSGVASAFAIVCASTLVLERLAQAGKGQLAAVHFAGVGVGIVFSAIIVSTLTAHGAGWQALWLWTGTIAFVLAAIAGALIPVSASPLASIARPATTGTPGPGLAGVAIAHGLFGFGYVITATFLVTIVREQEAIRPLEPWVWLIVGLATITSVPLWHWLGRKIGLMNAYAIACLVEAVSVAASVAWVSPVGVWVSAILFGGTFMGLTALGMMGAREASPAQPQRALGLSTASFGVGQMIGPTVAGLMSEHSGSLTSASMAAAAALVVAACFAAKSGAATRRASRFP